MRFDKQNQLCAAQAFTGAATVSTNSYDTQAAAADPTIGRRMAMLILPTVDAACTSVLWEVIQADNAALTTNVEALGSITVLEANHTTDDQIELPIPQGVKTRRYLGVRNTITGGAQTTTADVYYVPQDEIPYYKSFTKINDAEV